MLLICQSLRNTFLRYLMVNFTLFKNKTALLWRKIPCNHNKNKIKVSVADKQNVSYVNLNQTAAGFVAQPTIVNITPAVYPVCNNSHCRKKLDANPGCRLVRCLECKKSMLLDNVYMTVLLKWILVSPLKTTATSFMQRPF